MAKGKYRDRTTLSWGDYKNVHLIDIPFDYLLDLYNSRKTADPKLLKYIEDRIKEDEAKKEKEEKVRIAAAKARAEEEARAAQKARAAEAARVAEEAKPVFRKLNSRRVFCKATDKIVFASEKEAKQEIRRIRVLEQVNKKPVRAYECEKCGGWHTTSLPFEEWEKQTEEDIGNWSIYSKIMLRLN